ncbi:MAG: hypothetical protein ABL962_19950 [Fimbriimonadaceae bacterium]
MNTLKTWNGAIIAALAVITAAVLFEYLVETPMARVNSKRQEQLKLDTETKALFKEVTSLKKANAPRIWQTSAESVGPTAMGKMSVLARSLGLTMLSFRPQKPEETGDLDRYRYILAIEGSFPKVIEFTRKAETPETKIAVDRIQLASKDGATDNVSATIGVVAYRERLDPKATSGKTSLASEVKTKP